MEHKYPKLSDFVASAKQLEKQVLDKSFEESSHNEIQQILNESVVTLSYYNQKGSSMDKENQKNLDTVDNIRKSVAESIGINAGRVKSIIAELTDSNDFDKEREEFWVNKLTDSFGLDKSLPLEERSALLEHKLATDEASLNLATYVIEHFKK